MDSHFAGPTRAGKQDQPLWYPVGARHDQGNGQATISAGKRELGGWEAVESGAEMSYGVTERYGAGF